MIAPRLAEHPGRAAAGARLPGRLHDHALGRAGRRCSPTRPSSSFVGEYRIPHSVLDVAQPTTQGPFAMPDYYYEFRRQQAAAIEAAPSALRRPRGRVRAAHRPRATARSRSTGSTAPRPRSSRSARRPERSRTSSTSCATRASPSACSRSPRSGRSPPRRSRPRLRGVDSVVVLDRADSPGGTPPLHAEVAAALYGSGCELTRRRLRARRPRPAPRRHPRRLRRRRSRPHRTAR